MATPRPSLTLRVLRHEGRAVATDLHKTFGERGGTIGRASQNDWVLPDPTRYLSSHHATVYFEQGAFHLVDCSSNGVFVNRDEHPLGIERMARLKHGDRLVLGDYEVAVEISGDAAGDGRAQDPLLMHGAADAAMAGDVPSAIWPLTGQAAGDPSWADLAAPRCAPSVGIDDEMVDPLQLLAAPELPRPRTPAAAQRDDAPLLATPFKPPRSTVPADWLEPLPLRARPVADSKAMANASGNVVGIATGFATTGTATQALEQASAALRQALAAVESLRHAVGSAPGAARSLRRAEAAHGLE